jgi:5-methyltetrahydrofolate--homocysteine methyltransferase
MPQLKTAVDALRSEGLQSETAVMVGGAPVNAKFARDIGADGYAQDAGEAVVLAKELMQATGTGTGTSR